MNVINNIVFSINALLLHDEISRTRINFNPSQHNNLPEKNQIY